MINRPTVLVTGASSGIGRATARRLAAEGYRVFGTSRRVRTDDNGVHMLTMDVRDEDLVNACVAEVLDRTGRMDVLINNAAIAHHGFAEETTQHDATAVFDTNVFGLARVTNAVLPTMRGQRSGQIINVGSLAAWVGEPGEAYYAGSKAALARYSEALRYEVSHLGIAVSLVELGPFVTTVLDAAAHADASITDYDGVRETAWQTLGRALERGDNPVKAAERIHAIVRARRPRSRYGIGSGAQVVPRLRTLAP